jgi:hypothetical protein
LFVDSIYAGNHQWQRMLFADTQFDGNPIVESLADSILDDGEADKKKLD